ncbi:Vacuolar protein sorting-associated protein 8, partial [Coemansia spiralis]
MDADTDTVPSTPRSALEPTPETEYECRIANLDSAPAQRTTDYFSWHQLADMAGKVPTLAEQFGAVCTVCMGDYVALGTERGAVVVTDYLGRVKAALVQPAAAAHGPVSALAFSADHLALVAGHERGFVAVWDWVKGTPVATTRPVQSDDRPGAAGHPPGTAVTAVGFVGASKHRYISASAGGRVLYHHIVRRLLTTVSTAQLGADAEMLYDAAALPQGSRPCAADDMGLVAVLTATSLSVWSTRHGVAQQFRTSNRPASPGRPTAKRAFAGRPYAGCVAWQPARGHTDGTGAALPVLAYSWGATIAVLAMRLEHDMAENGQPRLRLEKERTWTAVEDVVLCRWIEAGVLLYMTRSQRLFVLETALRQETAICESPPGAVAGRPWVTLATGAEAEPLYAHAMCVYRRRLFALCGVSVYTGRLLSWAERLELLVEQGLYIDAITLATGFYQGRTGQVVAGLPRPSDGDAGRARRQALVGRRLEELMRAALERAFAADPGPEPARGAEALALASVCIVACLALGNLQLLFGDVFEHYAGGSDRQHAFLVTAEPFILSGEITHVPPQILNAMVDSYGTTPALVSRLGEMLMSLKLRPGEFDIDRVLAMCRQRRLWRTFARVWLGMGDPIAPVMTIVAAASEDDLDDGASAASDDEAPHVVVIEYLDMVLRGRSYPSDQPITPQARAEKYSTLAAEFVFPPIEASQARGDVVRAFGPLLALLGLGTERFLAMLRRVLGDPFTGFINLIVRPVSRAAPRAGGSERTLRRASQVKSFLQIVVDTFNVLATAEPAVLSRRQVGLLSSFALSLYATHFPLIYLADATLAEWSSVLLRLDDTSTRAEREHAFELLFRLNPPRAYEEYVDRVRDAGFLRVLEQIYTALEQHDNALRTRLEHPDFACRRTVFPAMRELAAAGRPRALACIAAFVRSSAARLVEVDADAFAAAVDAIPALDHDAVVEELAVAPALQLAYLRALLDPAHEALPPPDERAPPNIDLADEQHIVVYPFQSLAPGGAEQPSRFPRAYHERYLELLCEFGPAHVVPYLRKQADLSPESLRFAHVQAVCSRFGVSDGVVWALVRLGDFSGALQTLLLQADQATERVGEAMPAAESGALDDVCRERLAEHLDATARNIDGCVDVCKSALARLGKADAASAADPAASDYRQLVSEQLCDLWLALLRRALGYLHATSRI